MQIGISHMPDAFHILNKSFLPCLRKYLKHITKQGVSAVNVRVYMHGHTQTRAHTQTHTQTHSHTHTLDPAGDVFLLISTFGF